MNFYLCGIGNPHPLIAQMLYYLAWILMLKPNKKSLKMLLYIQLIRMDVLWMSVCECDSHHRNMLLIPQKSSWHKVSPTTHWVREISFRFILVNNVCVCVHTHRSQPFFNVRCRDFIARPRSKLFSINSVCVGLTVYLKWKQVHKNSFPCFSVRVWYLQPMISWFYRIVKVLCAVVNATKFYPIWQKREKYEQIDGE